MEKAERADNLIKLLRESETAYYCKYCGRHLPHEKDADVFVHDDVVPPRGLDTRMRGRA